MITTLAVLALTSYAHPELVVSTQWLSQHLDDADVIIVDTRTRGYEESHIPGAVWLDIDASRDKNNAPTFLPDLDAFVATLELLGISNETRVIFYDDRGGIYGTRPWVLMRWIGLDNAAIVDGGWPKWLAESNPTSSDSAIPDRGTITVGRNDRWIATADDVSAAVDSTQTTLLDTRTEAETTGTDLRGNPRGGVIPGATHLFWEETLEGEFMSFKSADALAVLFENAGLDPDKEIIAYCQGAGRAAHELFVLVLMGYDDMRLYLGSMEDWSRQPSRPLQ